MRKLCLLLPRFAVKTVAFDRSANHPKLYSRRLFQTGGFGNAQTSFALTSLRSQDRRIRPRLPTILNFLGILYVHMKNVKLYLIASHNMFLVLF